MHLLKNSKLLHITHLTMIFITALILRWIVVASYQLPTRSEPISRFWQTLPFSAFFFGDSSIYHQAALDLALQGSYGKLLHPPMTSTFLALFYLVFGPSFAASHLIYSLMGASISLIFALLATRWFNHRTGIITGWVTALSFSQLILSGSICAEIPALLYIGAGLLLLENKTAFIRFFAGLLFGAATLTRSELIIFMILLFLVSFFQNSSKRKSLIPVIIGFFIILSIWSFRNYRYLSNVFPEEPFIARIMPTGLNGPFNFYIGNGPTANGGYRFPDRASNPWLGRKQVNLENPEHIDIVLNGFRYGLECIKSNPSESVFLAFRKITYFFGGYFHGFFQNNFPEGLRGSFRNGDMWRPESRWFGFIVFVACLYGLYQSFKTAKFAIFVISIFIFSGFLNAILFFGLARHAAIQMPFYFMGLGVTIDQALNRLSSRIMLRRLIAIIAFLVIFVQISIGIASVKNPYLLSSLSGFMKKPEDLTKRFGPVDPQIEAAYTQVMQEILSAPTLVLSEEEFSITLTNFAIVIAQKNMEKAEEFLDWAIHLDISNPVAWQMKGRIAARNPARIMEAIQFFNRFLILAPESDEAADVQMRLNRMSIVINLNWLDF
jgi:hypothetical protein